MDDEDNCNVTSTIGKETAGPWAMQRRNNSPRSSGTRKTPQRLRIPQIPGPRFLDLPGAVFVAIKTEL